MTKEEKPQRKKYTWEVVTRAPLGVFRVGDREFTDQPFTRAERAAVLASVAEKATTLEVVIAGLNARHSAEHQVEVTPAWIDEQLGDADVGRLIERMLEMMGLKQS